MFEFLKKKKNEPEPLRRFNTWPRSDELRLMLNYYQDTGAAARIWRSYNFYICDPAGYIMGRCDLRVDHNRETYYAGNIGYRVNEPYRGHHYAEKASRLLFELARELGMTYVIITCNPDNLPSRRTCERLGGELLEIAELPEDNMMRKDEGETHKCIFRYDLTA